MKKLLILTAIVCSVVLSPTAHAEWTAVTESVDKNSYYVDFSRIRKLDSRVYYWRLTDLAEPFKEMMSFKIYV